MCRLQVQPLGIVWDHSDQQYSAKDHITASAGTVPNGPVLVVYLWAVPYEISGIHAGAVLPKWGIYCIVLIGG